MTRSLGLATSSFALAGRIASSSALALVAVGLVACSSTDDSPAGAVVDGGASRSSGATTSDASSAAPDASIADAGGTRPTDGGVSAASDAGTRAPDAGGGGVQPSAGCGKTGSKTGDFTLDAKDGKGNARTYEVLVAAPYDASTPLALSFVYHGAGGTSAQAKGFGLQSAPGASAAGIFVFPQGIAYENDGVGWDDSCGGYDMPFFDAMLAAIEADYCVDESRVFAAGFSWGGDHTTALDCCRGGAFRAVAVGSSTDEFSNEADAATYDDLPCPQATTAAIRFTHATGGDSAYPAPEFATTSALYRSWNTCSSSSTAVSPSPCVSYDGCASPLVECSYDGLGHALPSGWGDDTWAFFSAAR